MNPYKRTMHKLSRTKALRWVLSKVLTPLDMRLKGSRFAPSTFGMNAPLCYLTTAGRRSGNARTVPLLYIHSADGHPVVVATNFGKKSHPGWAHNLEATPSASLEIDDIVTQVTARRCLPEEQANLWPLFDDIWPGYEEYREIAPRDIRMFFLLSDE